MAQYDLSATLAAHLDRHLVLPVLEFLQEKRLFPKRDLLQAKLELVSGTKMVDFAADEYKSLHKTEEVPARMTELRDAVHVQLHEWKVACEPLLRALEDAERVKSLRATGQFNLESLGVPAQALEDMYRYAKLIFDCGMYSQAAALLAHYRLLSSNEERRFSALWGKLAAESLVMNWEAARADLFALRDSIDQRPDVDQLQQLQQRTWLAHWSLFVFFNIEDGRGQLLDMLFEDSRLLNAVQMNAPHLLRYLAASVVVTARRREIGRLVRILRQEAQQHSDPVTEFVVALLHDYDFDVARARLQECEVLLANDFHLHGVRAEFMDRARALVFETTCRIHKNVDIGVLKQRLDLKETAGQGSEQGMVDLIRASSMDAKIDSDRNTVVVGTHYPSLYQQVIDVTRELSWRTSQMAVTVEKKYAAAVVSASTD